MQPHVPVAFAFHEGFNPHSFQVYPPVNISDCDTEAHLSSLSHHLLFPTDPQFCATWRPAATSTNQVQIQRLSNINPAMKHN